MPLELQLGFYLCGVHLFSISKLSVPVYTSSLIAGQAAEARPLLQSALQPCASYGYEAWPPANAAVGLPQALQDLQHFYLRQACHDKIRSALSPCVPLLLLGWFWGLLHRMH